MEKNKKPNRVIQVLNELSNRFSFFSSLGRQYAGKRNLYTAFGYPKELTFDDIFAQYTRQDIANTIIDKPVGVSWRGEVLVIEGKDDQETALEKEWKNLVKTFKLKSKFIALDKLVGLSSYGIILIGLDDIKITTDWSNEVTPGKRMLKYIKVFGEDSAKINTFVTDTKDSRFGMPLTYTINIKYANGGTSSFVVHYSRVIHVVGNSLDDEVKGVPRLTPVFNRLMDLEKLVGGSAEMFWRGARPGFSAEVDPEYTLPTTAEDTVKDQMDQYEHDLRRLFMIEGVKMTPLQMQIADPKAHVDVQIQMISAETEIPKRILTGSERGELASSQDQDEWYSFIQTRREEYIEPVILIPFIDRLIELKILPPASTGEYGIKWADLFSISEKEKATIGLTRSQALSAYAAQPMAQAFVSPEAFFEFFLGLTDVQIQLITEMKEAEMLEEQRQIAREEEIIPEEQQQTPEQQTEQITEE